MKPLTTVRLYGGYQKMRDALNKIDATFTETDCNSNNFWGIAFAIEKPRGKGSQAKIREIYKAVDPV